ncbi:MAG: hypothetical protein WAO28_01215 [Candidatus Microsaccharimonas sp.]
MAKASKSTKTNVRRSSKKAPASSKFKKAIVKVKAGGKFLLTNGPHQSFRRTRSRDYKRPLDLPGFFAFTKEVNGILWRDRKLFSLLAVVYVVLVLITVGMNAQDLYTSLTNTLRDTGGEVIKGDFSKLSDAGALVVTIATTGLGSDSLTEVQQMYAVIVGLLLWLTTVWLLRNIFSNNKVRLRDGLYNAGTPIIPTFIVGLVMVIQLFPLALAILAYSAAASTGLLDNGVEAMLFWIADGLLVLISLYWVSATLFALIVVTLPGIYPFQALKLANRVVASRRMRMLMRAIWMALCIVVGWLIVMIPIILIDTWIKGLWSNIEWLPIVPTALLILSPITLIWSATYIYLLYRKVIDDDESS